MAFNHSMNAEITFKRPITDVQLQTALKPLAEYFDWSVADTTKDVEASGEDKLEIFRDVAGGITGLELYTCGDVVCHFANLVEATADALSAIAMPGHFELRDHNTGDLENAISRYWYGQEPELSAAKQRHAWREAADLLRGSGVPEPTLQAMEALASASPSTVKVAHWEAYSLANVDLTHQIDISDQRSTNGQVFIDAGSLEGDVEDCLAVCVEVSTDPLNGIDHLACAHLHFDSDNLACSVFKMGRDVLLLRPESGVELQRHVLDDGSLAYWVK